MENCLSFLALCHTIVIDKASGKFNAASPDELALVNMAKQQGYVFKEMDADDNMTISIDGRLTKYKLLHVCEFNSTRKRMSVIVKNSEGKIKLLCKGADSIIHERLTTESKNSIEMKQTQKCVD